MCLPCSGVQTLPTTQCLAGTGIWLRLPAMAHCCTALHRLCQGFSCTTNSQQQQMELRVWISSCTRYKALRMLVFTVRGTCGHVRACFDAVWVCCGDSWQHGWARPGLQPVSLATYPMSSGACSCSRLLDMTPAALQRERSQANTHGWTSETDRGVHIMCSLCATHNKAIKPTPLYARLQTHLTSEIVSRHTNATETF